MGMKLIVIDKRLFLIFIFFFGLLSQNLFSKILLEPKDEFFVKKLEYQSFKKQAPSIYTNLKRTSTVSAEPKEEHKSSEQPKDDIGKVRATVESSKIKDLIKNLGKN